MAEAAVSTTINTIGDLLIGEAKFLYGVRDEVEKMQKELEHMECFLKDADKKQHTDEGVRKCTSDIKDLCYDIEDVLETFVVKVAPWKGMGLINMVKRIFCLPCECIALHKIGVEIGKIEDRISHLTERLERYGVKKAIEAESSKEADENEWQLRQTYAHEDEVDFVGMEDQIEQLLQQIVSHNNKADKVITILGMGGLGKTTLAKKIYKHSQVRRCFGASTAWVCITRQLKFKAVLQDILRQLLTTQQEKQQVKDMDVAELVRVLYQLQKEKKCMVVLDDVWEINHWIMLKKAFPIRDQAANSKLLLTTRKTEFAKIGHLHQLRDLTEDEGWRLLRKKAFPDQEEKDIKLDTKLEVSGREIVHKCGYLPLAIALLGGILKSKSSLSDWQMVCKNIDSHLSKEEGGRIENVLALSYNDLPYNLKPCFLSMGIFQEDEAIKARELYHLWIAEGMVSKKQELMIDAEHNLNELASRSMVQVQMDMSVGRIKSCKLHDLMRDLCLKKGEEEGFLESFDMNVHGDISSFPNIIKARKLAVHLGKYVRLFLPWDQITNFPWDQITNPSLRTLSLCGAEVQGEPKFKLCRVLVLESCGSKLPKQMSKMVLLRYLSLKDSWFDKLPSSVGDLPYLEILDLRTLLQIYIPHNIFSKMKQLRHLYLRKFHCGGSKKLRLNGLSRLESLKGFDDKLCCSEDLAELVQLRYFRAELRSSGDGLFIVINHIDTWRKIKWVKIKIVDIVPADIGKMLTCSNLSDLRICTAGMDIFKLPKYESQFWPNLMRLTVRRTRLDEESMEFLKKLPNLRELRLLDSFIVKEISFGAADFPELRSLTLILLRNLKKLRVDKGALPNLSSFEIDSCLNLETIPDDELRHLVSLKRLDIHQNTHRRMDLAERIEVAERAYKAALRFMGT